MGFWLGEAYAKRCRHLRGTDIVLEQKEQHLRRKLSRVLRHAVECGWVGVVCECVRVCVCMCVCGYT